MRDAFFKNAWSKVRWIAFVGIFIMLVTACSDDLLDTNYNEQPIAFVSFYHASPDAPGLTVSVDDRSVFNEIEYSEYSGYLNFYTGNRHFKINTVNAANSLVDTTFQFSTSKVYSVFLIDQLSGMEALLLQDTAETPSAGKAMVRFVHLSPDTSPLNIVVDGEVGDPLFDGQSFKEGSAFKEVSADVTGFEVRTAEGGNVLLSVDDLDLQAGRYYTIITRGFSNPPQGNNNVLSVQVIKND